MKCHTLSTQTLHRPAAAVLVKTKPISSGASSLSDDVDQMLHCRAPIGAMGKESFQLFFLLVSVPDALLISPQCPVLCTQMLIRCFPYAVTHLCLPVCTGTVPAVTASSSLPPSPPVLEIPLDFVLWEKAKGAKGCQSRIAEFALPLFLYESLHEKLDNGEESPLGWF